MSTHRYSPTRRDIYRDAEARRKLRDTERRRAREGKRAARDVGGRA